MLNRPTGLYPDNECISLGDMSGSDYNLWSYTSGSGGYHLNWDSSSGYYVSGSSSSNYRTSSFIAASEGEIFNITSGTLAAPSYNWNSYISYKIYAAWYNSDKKLIGLVMQEFLTSGGTSNMKNVMDTNFESLSVDWVESVPTSLTAPEGAAYLRVVTSSLSKSVVVQRHWNYKNGLVFSAVVSSGTALETWSDSNGETRVCAALCLWYHDKYVYFHFNESTNSAYAPYLYEGTDGDRIVLTLPLDTDADITGEYKYIHYTKIVISSGTKNLIDIIRPGTSFSWKLRVYGKNSLDDDSSYIPNVCVGYGTISDYAEVYSNNSSSKSQTGYRYTIFPHTGIYDDVIDYNGAVSNSNIADTVYNIFKNYDENIKYWLFADGYQIKIDKYRLYPYTYDSGEPSTSLSYDDDFDGYGNPLHGYAVVTNDDLKAAMGNGYSSLADDLAGESYSIYTNYIDSKWGYFEIYDDAEITVTENKGEELNEGEYKTISYSSLELNVTYSQSQGIELNYYSYKVYSQNDDDEWELDYASGNFYNQSPSIYYDRFFNEKNYKIVITLVDAKQRVYEKEYLFTTAFPTDSANLVPDIGYYREHNSIIVDFSELNSATSLQNLVGYRVYKTLGTSDKLYEVANIDADSGDTKGFIIEDFVVGDNCEYTYYVYPILLNSDGLEYVAAPLVTDTVTIDDGAVSIMGLTEIEDKTYEVDVGNVWVLRYNLEDGGYTLNTDKNFYDTFNQYNQETVGNRKYITKSLSGLIGNIDCSTDGDYRDNYDMLVSWNNFIGSAGMKCLVDLRGLILPGNFEANPTGEYFAGARAVNAKFNWRQKADLDVIKIYARVLPFNPLKGIYLKTSEDKYLATTDPDVLSVNG